MAFLRCNECGHKEFFLPRIHILKFVGLGVTALGVASWFGFSSDGPGVAFAIAATIGIVGGVIFFTAKDLAKKSLMKENCPKCERINWDETIYDNK